MKLAALSLTVLALGLTFSIAGIAAGTESHGGGTEYQHPTTPAWFLSASRAVRACVKVGAGFRFADGSTLQASEAAKLVQDAHDTWFAYLVERGLYPVAHDPNQTELARGFSVGTACAGNEDLTVYFGAEDAVSLAAKKQFRDPFGFAVNVGVNPDREWRKGIIWIAPPGPVGPVRAIWTRKRLKGELLHELGHTLGNGHVPGTVMDARLGDVFSQDVSDSARDDLVVDQIDQTRALRHGIELTRMKVVEANLDFPNDAESYSAFHFLLHRTQVGVATRELDVRQIDGPKALELHGTFTLTDALGTAQFHLDAHSPFYCNDVGDRILTRYWLKGSDNVGGIFSQNCQFVGTLTDEAGTTTNVAVDQDSTYKMLVLTLTDGPGNNWYNELFQFWPPWQYGTTLSTEK